jgi:hypothetical protein
MVAFHRLGQFAIGIRASERCFIQSDR